MEKQIELGGEVLQEWPKESWGWGFASIRNVWKQRHRERRYFEASRSRRSSVEPRNGCGSWRGNAGNHIHGKCEGGGKDGSGLDATTWSSQPTSLDADATGPRSFSTAAGDRQEHGLRRLPRSPHAICKATDRERLPTSCGRWCRRTTS